MSPAARAAARAFYGMTLLGFVLLLRAWRRWRGEVPPATAAERALAALESSHAGWRNQWLRRLVERWLRAACEPLLRRGGLLEEADGPLLRELDLATVRRCAAGDAVFLEGDSGSEVYLLMSGRAEVFVESGRPLPPLPGARVSGVRRMGKSLGNALPGACLGEEALSRRDGLRTATVVAAEPTALLALSRRAYCSLLTGRFRSQFNLQCFGGLLESLPSLADWSAGERAQLEQRLAPEPFSESLPLRRPGERGRWCWAVVYRGEVGLVAPVAGREAEIARVGERTMLGEESFVSEQTCAPYGATGRSSGVLLTLRAEEWPLLARLSQSTRLRASMRALFEAREALRRARQSVSPSSICGSECPLERGGKRPSPRRGLPSTPLSALRATGPLPRIALSLPVAEAPNPTSRRRKEP